jgi:hypothetical protein
MIKRETKTVCKSYFKNNDLYDSKREVTFSISVFGLNIYKRIEHYNCDVKEGRDNKPGFRNETT